MRRYKAKIKLFSDDKKESIGSLGERLFKDWFESTFHSEQIFKQKADRDYQKIDFADEKGYTYQVKTTSKNTYTFNCSIDDIRDNLKADVYVFIQVRDSYAYIEDFYSKDFILNNAVSSFRYGNTFVWAKDLQQNQLFI